MPSTQTNDQPTSKNGVDTTQQLSDGFRAQSRPTRAIVQDRYGTTDVWYLSTTELPDIGNDEVLVEVHAAGMDRGTWHLMTGLPYLMRLMGFGFRRPTNRVPGMDVAGTVVAVGPGVRRFGPGDAVFGISRGSFTDYAAAAEDKLAHKPADLTFEQAAVVAISGLTALQALRDAGRVKTADKVLIIGASGGVGSYATQLAKAMGAEVTGVASTAKVDFVRSLGADHVIDYTRQDFGKGDERYDVVLDIGGSSPLSRLRATLAPKGTLVIVGGESDGKVTGGFDRQLCALALSPFVSQRLTMVTASQDHADLEVLAQYIEAGQVIPAVDEAYPLGQAADAMKRLEEGQVRGKLAITVREESRP